MKRQRAMDQRRYTYEKWTGRKCNEKERALLKEFTPKQVIAIIAMEERAAKCQE